MRSIAFCWNCAMTCGISGEMRLTMARHQHRFQGGAFAAAAVDKGGDGGGGEGGHVGLQRLLAHVRFFDDARPAQQLGHAHGRGISKMLAHFRLQAREVGQ
jgi:hypothetical protein